MCEANYTALEIEVKNDFNKYFDFDILDEHFYRTETGLEICYEDFDLNKLDDYNNSPLIERSFVENDGRGSYIKVFAIAEYEDYFGD